MARKLDLLGHRFGKLLVVSKCDELDKTQSVMWLCKCECGSLKKISAMKLRHGGIKSCGCSQYDRTHGLTNTLTYETWSAMKQRCSSEKYRYFRNGIRVCERWQSFENFYADMGEQPVGKSLERRDNSKGYSPDNCVWATTLEQNLNRSITNFIEYGGERLCITHWARRVGLSAACLHRRITKMNWSIEKALTTPRLREPRNQRKQQKDKS